MLKLLHLTFYCETHLRAMKGNKDCKRIVEGKTFGGYSGSETRDFATKGKKTKLYGKFKRIVVYRVLNLVKYKVIIK